MIETRDIQDGTNAVSPWSGVPVSACRLTLYRGKAAGFCSRNLNPSRYLNPNLNPGRDTFENATAAFDAALDGN